MNKKRLSSMSTYVVGVALCATVVCSEKEIVCKRFSEALPAATQRNNDSFDNSVLSQSVFHEQIELADAQYELVGLRIDNRVSCAIITPKELAGSFDIDSQELSLIKAWVSLQVSRKNLNATQVDAASSFQKLLRAIEAEEIKAELE